MKMKSKTKKIIISAAVIVLTLAVAGTVYAAVNRPKSIKEIGYKNEQPGFKEFSYTLKGDYKSRDDVIKEMLSLNGALKDNIDGCSPEYTKEAIEKFNKLDDKL